MVNMHGSSTLDQWKGSQRGVAVAETAIRAVTDYRLAKFLEPSGIIINPEDWAEVAKDQRMLWGFPVTLSDDVPVGSVELVA